MGDINGDVTNLHDLRVLNTFTFGEVRDVVQAGMVLLTADHFFYRDEQHLDFALNPANTLPYQALRALQDRAIIHIAEVLKQKSFRVSAAIRRKGELINHRDAVSHPVTVDWRRPEMRAFSDEKRKWLDYRPCLVWDMHRSIVHELQTAGEQPELEGIEATEAMSIIAVLDTQALGEDRGDDSSRRRSPCSFARVLAQLHRTA